MEKHSVHQQRRGIRAQPFPLHDLPPGHCSKNQAIPTAHHTNKAILQVNAQDHTQTYVHTSDKMSLISEGEGNKLEATQVTRKAKVLHIITREDSQVKPTSHILVKGIATKDASMISKLEMLKERIIIFPCSVLKMIN